MPGRAPLQIATRRHPLSIAVYLLVAILGLLFITHAISLLFITRGIHSHASTKEISPLLVGAWEWSMLAGGVVAIAGVLWPHRLDRGLLLESFGSALAGVGLCAYASVAVYLAGWNNPALALLACLIVGLVLRTFGAARDLGKVESAALVPMEPFLLPVEPTRDSE
jgi:hypothetical protein